MKQNSLLLLGAGLALIGSGTLAQAQTTTQSTSTNLVALPIPDRAVRFDVSDAGVSKPIIWGMDAGGWTNNLIWTTGINYLGASNLKITRVATFPVDTLFNNALSIRQKALVKERLDMIALVGQPLQIMLNPGANEIAWYSRTPIGYARYAQLMELTKQYVESFGHTVVSITGYNEPDAFNSGVSMQNDYDLIAACKARPGLSNLRFCGASTLNNDFALSWYNFVRPAGLNEGNTHQLAGACATYIAFQQAVRANGHYATNDEVHDIVEGIVGAQYGLQAGIYWGYANLARGEFSKASSNGVRLGYAEHQLNWTAAAVYRQPGGQVQAFSGGSERQATTTTYSYVSKDRDVYYEGNGPQREYSLVMPGGTGYMTNDQPYAERVLPITWGEDVQPVINGRYVLVNRSSGKVMEVPGGSLADGVDIQQNNFNGALYQQFNVVPVSNRIGGDFSYFSLTAAHSNKALDNYGFSLANNTRIVQWTNSVAGNQQYYLEYADDGFFRIRNHHSSKCLDIAPSGTNVVQQERNAASQTQQWRMLPIGAAVEFVAPAAPTNVVATANPESVRLNWTASPDPDVAGYHVYRAPTAGGPFSLIARTVPGTVFVDNTATLTGTYYYKVKAVDASLNRSAYSAQVAATTTGTPALVAQLGFDNNSFDSSPNGNHAAVTTNLGYVAGKVGTTAAAFNGTSAYAQLPATTASQPDITVTSWVYWTGNSYWERIFDFGNDETQYLFLTPKGANGGMRFTIRNGGAEQILDAPTTLTANAWVHVAVTMGSTGVRLYVDGQQVAQSTTITLRPLDFKPIQNYLGRSQFSTDPFFNGRLDDFRVYNYALSAANVATVMAQQPLAAMPAALAQEVVLHPNPATGQTTLTLPAALSQAPATAELLDALGRAVRTQALPAGLTTHTLSLAGVDPGLYTLRLTTSSGVVAKKLAIN